MARSNRVFLFATLIVVLAAVAQAVEELKYNPSTEITIEGNALYVADYPTKSDWTGVFAVMRDPRGGEIEVHLAPSFFLSKEGIELHTGDAMKVAGSRVKWHGGDIILARELDAQGKSAQLRDAEGKRRW
jgi:hypothetical protein